jgi:hypothetical protein
VPLRDHFRPPVSRRSSWEGFHGGWPAVIVQKLLPSLPTRLVAEPRVHLGSYYKIDACPLENAEDAQPAIGSGQGSGVGVATAPQAPPVPTLTLDAEFPEQDAYEVLIFDLERDRRLVAAVEIVSPANKDRPESRQLFVAKCFNLLRQDVCVWMIDLVTIRQFKLYCELLALLGVPTRCSIRRHRCMRSLVVNEGTAGKRNSISGRVRWRSASRSPHCRFGFRRRRQ